MMKIINLLGCLFLFMTLFSCVEDGVDECPVEPVDPVGGVVKLNFFVEKFRSRSLNPLDDSEPQFCSIVNHLQYYLYKDGKFVEPRQVIDTFEEDIEDRYALTFTNLEPGSYDIVIIANCTKDALKGDPIKSSNLVVIYPGCGNSEDYFSAVDSFVVLPDQSVERNIALLRMHGVVRFTFENMPEDVAEFEILMDNVSNEKWILDDYMEVYRATQRYSLLVPVTRAEVDEYIIGTFPTVKDGYSSYTIKLYREGESEPYTTHLVSDDLVVERNQLLDISTAFNNGQVSFDVDLNSDWNGSTSGGSTGLE